MFIENPMSRKYQLKRRAEQQDATRQRIIEATVELHTTLGPSQTTISAIAARAGVQRLTVYRHFPDERALFSACSAHYRATNPAPDPEGWRQVTDPESRLRLALAEVYAYFRRSESSLERILRDANTMPILREVGAPTAHRWAQMREVLMEGRPQQSERRRLILAAIGHALAFPTWQSLTRQQGLTDEQSAELMVGLVRCVVTA
jgi:AcrR family transcriptional regulator